MIDRVTEPDPSVPGRALIEAGAPVAGSMCSAAAAVVFESSSVAVQVDPRLAACLRAAAAEAAPISIPRERVRAGAVLAFAVEHSVTLARSARRLRNDAFFAGRPGARPAAGEVLEGIVTAARLSADERRVRHLGYLLAEVAHSTDVDAELVGRALRLAEQLNWRQLAILAGVGRRDRVPMPMAALDDEPAGWNAWAAREDVTDLQRSGLLDPPVTARRPGGAALPRLRAADLRLTRRGVLVHRLLVLDVLRDDAVAAALADLGLPRS
ncbi:hypothetical protein E4P39_10995 [Blastococcus sp. CT_GayMR19]|uniref:hypothetical protein n=1 Tax=Blastococcus sp. CT_GayMR19 TaxID=2559608 RepID=UPI0010746150|nr:hypothetical protein [Blastococcus sp. CT_GayMR19]TFV75550.1 hypothetical protein E4P39_10995 [Blastococcus sp. CT_GayMR19]